MFSAMKIPFMSLFYSVLIPMTVLIPLNVPVNSSEGSHYRTINLYQLRVDYNHARINNDASVGQNLEQTHHQVPRYTLISQPIPGQRQEPDHPSQVTQIYDILSQIIGRPIILFEQEEGLHPFQETDQIENTILLGYMPKNEYLSPSKEHDLNTLDVTTVDQSGVSVIGTSQIGVRASPGKLEADGCSHKYQEEQWQPKRHQIVPFHQVLSMLDSTESVQPIVRGEPTVLNKIKGFLAKAGKTSKMLKVKGKKIEGSGHKNHIMNSKNTKNNESSNSDPLFKISHVLLGSAEDNTCAACLEEFQGPQKDAKNMFSVFSFEKVLMIKGCEHYFHHHCLQKWILGGQKNSCPVCRQPVKDIPSDLGPSQTSI
ncbi:hypothetical protein PGT21_015015 [Puccinia graminis f. sp. tritici]|uniref:RING-type domain-containing protein n=1 Tax=Puccinia graminis f. sp. tritici TaxID=56615 RepID=A0A5B0MDG6_PUCGR|nr:hypothetical protein PGT21_015015 [Puccinia graminis f. sp. tritici]